MSFKNAFNSSVNRTVEVPGSVVEPVEPTPFLINFDDSEMRQNYGTHVELLNILLYLLYFQTWVGSVRTSSSCPHRRSH